MPNIRLTKNAWYTVRYGAVKNPLAGVKGVGATMPVQLMRGVNENATSRKLQPGELIQFVGHKTGWGSDPGEEAIFRTEDGFEGEFFPAGIWGGIDDRLLAPDA